ncbi:YidB family protein [Streptomyces netropsis]
MAKGETRRVRTGEHASVTRPDPAATGRSRKTGAGWRPFHAPTPGPLPRKAWDMADDDLGTLLGGLLGGGRSSGTGNLLAALLGTLGDSGQGGGNPLAALLSELRDGGLEGKTQSWVGSGANEPITGAEVAQALPYQTLDRVAQQAGIAPEEAADQLAAALPEAVDKLTPDGVVPQGSLEDLIKARL